MNIFNKYKSHFIAAIGSLSFLGLLILLLCIKPFGDSLSLNPDSLADQELPIQFQQELEKEAPLPPPANTKSPAEETTTQAHSTMTSSSEDVEKDPASQEVNVGSANPDSVILSELKKVMEELKKATPDDSLPKEQIEPKYTQQAQKVLTDNTSNSYEERKFYYDNYRAIMNLKKVYPYVLRTKEIVTKMNKKLATITNNKEKHKLIKETEKELFAQFEKDIRNMSTSQGKLLLKLIARETDQTAYGLIKTYKGAIPATFWYGVGLLFHENLKSQYDSIGEDAQLEKVVRKYKLGKF